MIGLRVIAVLLTVSLPLGAQVPRVVSAELTGSRIAPASYYTLRQLADDARRAKRFKEADSLYQILTTSYPIDSNAWELQASTEMSLGAHADAARSWESAWRAGSWPRGEVAYMLARLHARLGHPTIAMNWIDSALANRLVRRPRLLTDTVFAAMRDSARFKRQAGMLPPNTNRIDGWRFDIAYFVEEAQRLHVGPSRPAFSRAFIDSAASLTRDAARLTDSQLAIGLVRLARQLGDGHSYLTPRTPIIPLQLYEFANGLFVVQGGGKGAELIGSRVVRIAGVSAESAMKVVAATVSSDNAMTPRWLGVNMLLSPSALYAMGLSKDSARVALEVVDRTGVLKHVDLSPEAWMPSRFLAPAVGAPTPAPLWLQHVEAKHWISALPEIHAVYAQYNQVGNDAKGTVAQFADSVSAILANTHATSLIVDVRHNNGGRRQLNTPLLVAMAAFKHASPTNRVFVVMGRGTFSAAQVFVSQAEWLVDPVYVGEPSSSRPNFVGEESGVVLPFSGIQGSVSSQMHQGSTFQDERPFIAPHIPIALTAEDYFANRDPVMETLTQVLKTSPLQP